MDRALWKIENYRDFLNERRALLANAANALLAELYAEPLGLIEAFLIREGTKAVFEGWRYLAEQTLERIGHVFHGPPAKMIEIGQSLARVAWTGVEGEAVP